MVLFFILVFAASSTQESFASQIEFVLTSYPCDKKFVLIDNKFKLDKLCYLVKKSDRDYQTNLIFDNLNYTIYLADKSISDQVVSLISFKICKTQIAELGIQNYAYINFTYTFSKYRQQGYNRILRHLVETIAQELELEYVVSLPFENANSRIVMEKMGYQTIGNIYLKKLR